MTDDRTKAWERHIMPVQEKLNDLLADIPELKPMVCKHDVPVGDCEEECLPEDCGYVEDAVLVEYVICVGYMMPDGSRTYDVFRTPYMPHPHAIGILKNAQDELI